MDHLYGLPDLTQWMPRKTSLFPAGTTNSCLNPPWLPPQPQMNKNKCRWARQETLTLLEIRSLLHHTFKHSNLKQPLWDQVSRIMRDEHGYNRSGRKCKEKFENLYKYYKKTKECKTGRQDGKNYRFFRQLEAICGESTNQYNSNTRTQKTNDPFDSSSTFQQNFLISENLISQPNPIELNTSLSERNDTYNLSAAAFARKKRVNKNELKEIEKIIELRMGVIMERQDVLMEKMMDNIEYKERVRASKEEEWRKEEATRFDEEYKILAKKKAFNEARDTELMVTLQTFAENEARSDESKGDASKMIDVYTISS